ERDLHLQRVAAQRRDASRAQLTIEQTDAQRLADRGTMHAAHVLQPPTVQAHARRAADKVVVEEDDQIHQRGQGAPRPSHQGAGGRSGRTTITGRGPTQRCKNKTSNGRSSTRKTNCSGAIGNAGKNGCALISPRLAPTSSMSSARPASTQPAHVTRT